MHDRIQGYFSMIPRHWQQSQTSWRTTKVKVLLCGGRPGTLAAPVFKKFIGQMGCICYNSATALMQYLQSTLESAKNHRKHRIPIVLLLYPSLEKLVRKSGDAGMELGGQVFNMGWIDLLGKSKHPEVMDEYPLRAFFHRLFREREFTITPHRFRHTVATHMMKSPERNLYAVKKLLGHVSITSTLEYIDESVDSLRDILETELM
ncbi:site-specific integrase [Klebsiella quasivariicola]|uniref:site-specific integrase n=1 Tax=Klebsiella quasivariicola TaxID=2026240 RepID=UPI0024798E5D|nr:site-specific integrase [Klebsiella quasivariicola]